MLLILLADAAFLSQSLREELVDRIHRDAYICEHTRSCRVRSAGA